jgi:hypothetical protein
MPAAVTAVWSRLSLIVLIEAGIKGLCKDWATAWNYARLVPLYWIAVQVPMWFVRVAAGWRIVRPDQPGSPTPCQSRQLRVAHFLAAMTLFALVFAVTQDAVHRFKWHDPTAEMADIAWAIGRVTAGLTMAAALIFLPILSMSLRWRKLRWIVAGALLYPPAIMTSWVAWNWQEASSDYGIPIWLMPWTCFLGAAIPIVGVLRLARWYGYRLVTIGRAGGRLFPFQQTNEATSVC